MTRPLSHPNSRVHTFLNHSFHFSMQTRTANKDTHPGSLVPKQARRSKAEMKEATAQKELVKAEAERNKAEKIVGLASIENQINKQAISAKAMAVTPKPSAITTKVARSVTATNTPAKKNSAIGEDTISKPQTVSFHAVS